ncbi:hypothetical protein ACLESO_07680 [Pyxidicoccus sp. 3LG]
MKTNARRRQLHAWAACLAVLGSMPVWAQAQAQAGGQVFIQGSEVNLRDKATTNAKVVAKVAIGTECLLVKGAPKQWVRLQCGEAEGFTLKSLVGAEKPSVEALLAQAQDTTLDAKVRLDAAMRAATLAPENEQALKLLSERFFDVNFEQLMKDRKKGGLRETSMVMREIVQDLPAVKRETVEEALLRELEKTEYDWHRFERRRNVFVSAMHRDGALVVYTGIFASMKGMHRFDIEDGDEEFRVVIESRSSSTVSEALKRALQQGARAPEPEKTRYFEVNQESPDLPVLSAESIQLYQSLPSRWYTLAKTATGEHFIDASCALWGVDLRMDLHRRASVWWRRFTGQGEAVDAVTRVLSISKTATGYQLQIRYRSGMQKTLTVTWPTAVPNVSRWDMAPYGETRHYAVANARNIPVDYSECHPE